MIPRMIQRTAGAVLLPVLLIFAGCAVNPATGERQLSFMSEAQEIDMGLQSDPGIVAQYGLYPDSAVQRYVRDLGLRLAAVSERPDLPWTFRVLDDPTINAFALPGGFIYVTRGILAHFENEAQLAGVLGHEIGHVTARHGVNQMSRAQLAQVGLMVGAVASETVRENFEPIQAGLGLGFLKFGRDDENQADELGVRYMTRLGYDPRELAGVMDMLSASSRLAGGGRLPEWQSTHPDPENRVASILARVERGQLVPADARVGRDALYDHLDGLTYGANPREGYVEGDVFHHPDLAFRFQRPVGWEIVNQKQAVFVVAPQQRAIVQLSIENAAPEAAAREFASQEGLQAGVLDGTSINGLEAVSLDFGARTEQGDLRGRASFILHDGRTYRLLGYAPAAQWDVQGPGVRSTIGSFRVEADPDVLAAQPARIELVTLRGAEPFDAFIERYPSSIDPERVALLNQVAPGGTLAEGRVKRVVGGR